MPLELSAAARTTAGILLLTIPIVQFGGWYMLQLVRGRIPATPFQLAFSRAGHAHAGVLVIFAIVCQILADAAAAEGLLGTVARSGVPLAAILMPAGFFLSSAGGGRTEPNQAIWILYAGAVALALGVVALGFALLTS
jgi:hypothetical protein